MTGRSRPTDVPAGESPATCARCGEPFPSERLLALHRGLAHYDALSEGEREAYADAYEAETRDLRLFRLQALAFLVVLYFAFLFAYALFA